MLQGIVFNTPIQRVIQKVDSVIHWLEWITRWVSLQGIHWKAIHAVDMFQLLNNLRQDYTCTEPPPVSFRSV